MIIVTVFQAFLGERPADAKRYLRETLKMANAEDLNRNFGILYLEFFCLLTRIELC